MDEPIPPPEQRDALSRAKTKTYEHARQLWDLVRRYGSTGDTAKPAVSPQHQSPDKYEYHSLLVSFLRVVPYLLVMLFLISFLWDFNNLSMTVRGYTLPFEGLLRIISVSGLIGFLTNWIAITMLFKPLQKRPILGHGLIPAQKDRIAFRLAQAVSEDLINPEIIKKKINESDLISRYRKQSTEYIRGIIDDPEFRDELKEWVVEYLDEMIADPEIRTALASHILNRIEATLHDRILERTALKAYSFVKGDHMQLMIEEALGNLPASIENGLDKVDDLLDQLPEKIEENSDTIENVVTNLLYKLINQLDVHSLVEDNLRDYDEQHLASIIQNATNEQLRYIQYLGAVLGVIGGFIIWEPLICLIILLTFAALLLLLDHLLLKRRKASPPPV